METRTDDAPVIRVRRCIFVEHQVMGDRMDVRYSTQQEEFVVSTKALCQHLFKCSEIYHNKLVRISSPQPRFNMDLSKPFLLQRKTNNFPLYTSTLSHTRQKINCIKSKSLAQCFTHKLVLKMQVLITYTAHSHSFSSLSYDRSTASSKVTSPQNAIQRLLFEFTTPSRFRKVAQQLLRYSSSSSLNCVTIF